MKRIIQKFTVAFHGIRDGLKHRSIATQFLLAFAACIAGTLMRLTALEWIMVVICIAMVITSEMLNTCVELLCDLYTMEYNERIRLIKDIAAGAVLVSSIGALVTALIILIQHIGGRTS